MGKLLFQMIAQGSAPSKDIYNLAIYNNDGVGEIFVDEIPLSGLRSISVDYSYM